MKKTQKLFWKCDQEVYHHYSQNEIPLKLIRMKFVRKKLVHAAESNPAALT